MSSNDLDEAIRNEVKESFKRISKLFCNCNHNYLYKYQTFNSNYIDDVIKTIDKNFIFMAKIMNILDVLKMNIRIPGFQRPYKWQNRNITELLDDINNAINESKKYEDYSYRIGTIILYEAENGIYDIVDGQQRLLSLAMIRYYLDNSFNCSLLEQKCTTKVSKNNLSNNYRCIKDWFTMKNELRNDFLSSFENCLEVVVITVEKLPSAFQLFDSQNTRGRELDPHDLLKAYHLREMKDDKYEMFHSVKEWEGFRPKKISTLFDVYLFAIKNWTKKEKTEKFSAKHIDYYKGIPETSYYTYAKRARNANPYFQITEPFNSGKDFFEMVTHYLTLLEDIEKELCGEKFIKIKSIIDENTKNNEKNGEIVYHSVGFKYAINLFKCALLCYYDKFHNFDEQAVKKLFTWALMLRVDMENLGFDSVNKYASCYIRDDSYTNQIPMFSEIVSARFHTDISNMLINVKRKTNSAKAEKWNKLYMDLKELNGLEK